MKSKALMDQLVPILPAKHAIEFLAYYAMAGIAIFFIIEAYSVMSSFYYTHFDNDEEFD